MSGGRWVKSVYVAAIVLLCVVVVAACSKGGKTGDSSTGSASPSAGAGASAAKEAIKFQLMVYDELVGGGKPLQDIKNYHILPQLTKDLLEKEQVQVEFIGGGPRDNGYIKNVDLKMASQDIPDSLYLSKAQAEQYGSQGALVDLAPLFKKYAPNVQKFIDANPGFKAFITNDQGKIFSVPNQRAMVPTYSWAYRKDLLDKLNLKAPTTADELTEALRAMKKANSARTFFPLAFEGSSLQYLALGHVFGAESKLNADGTLTGIYSPTGGGTDYFSPGFKKMIEYLNMLYTEGLLDPESANFANNEESLTQKMVTGNAAITFRTPLRAREWQAAGRKTDPAYTFTSMAPLKNIADGKQFLATTAPYEDGRTMAVSAKSKHPEAPVKFLDYLFSPEGTTLRRWGIEGQSYKVENGKKKFLVTFEQTVDEQSQGKSWTTLNKDFAVFFAPPDAEAGIALQDADMQNQLNMLAPFIPKVPYVTLTLDQQKQMNDLTLQYGDKGNQWVTQFITGKKPMSEWDAFLSDMDKLGYKKASAIWQDAYKKYLQSVK
ncbi:extracellular solute-binding protein [Paenibacillus cymbidii]|uniref:extracellular solute-binding protein n=1 Tax=Paenibacillus cymbidii TaxID=1639034 RepID=UPI00143693A6|nr:extracellular solute-binding protein [Paenibacillus cymbidii]